ncbi:MAG TPA: hypothetical protein VFA33_07645 [Bryobacteraceae bacterium]|nr:hypothetical protein [Bryobacteraceae bacterium]
MTLEEMIRDLRESLTVTTAVTLRNEQRLQEHLEWIAANEQATARHREWLQQHEAAMQSITEKLDRLEDLILRGRGSNGH